MTWSVPVWLRLAVWGLVLALYLGVGVFDHSLWSPTEPAVAGVVYNMYAHGDLALPRINTFLYFEKPPLCYWLSTLACRLGGGLDDGLVRLPATLLGLLCLALVYAVGKRRYREETALVLLLLAATGFAFYELAHRASSDMVATALTFLCFALFVGTLPPEPMASRRRLGLDFLFALVLAVSFYAKNFYTYLIVLPPVFLYLAWRRQFGRLIILGGMMALLSILLVTPWVLALYKSGGMDYIQVVFLNNTIGRFFDLGADFRSVDITPLDDASIVEKGTSPLFYLQALLSMSLPWVLFYAGALAHLFRRGTPKSEYRLFLKIALITMPVVLTLSSSRVMEYLMPLLFILLLIGGDYVEALWSGQRPPARWERRALTANAYLVGALLLAAPVALAVLLRQIGPALWLLPAALGLAFLYRASRPLEAGPPGPAAGARSPRLQGESSIREERTAAAAVRPRAGLGFLGLTAALLCVSLSYAMPYLDEQKSYRFFFDDIREAARGRELYTTFCDDRRLPQMTYYLQQRVPVVKEDELVGLAASGRPIGLILPINLYERKSNDLSRIPHTVIRTERGKKSYVWVGIP